ELRRRVALHLPGVTGLLQEMQRGRFYALGLREVYVVALLHAAHGSIACVLVRVATHHVVEQALAHGTVGGPHFFQPQAGEDLSQDGDAAGEDRAAVLRQRCELELAHVAGLDQVGDGALETRGRDGERLGIELADGLADRPHGARAARSSLPAAAPEGRLHRLELEARRYARGGHALHGDLAVAEEPLAQRYAAHLQALELEGAQALPNDELGAAAADVRDQAPPGLARHGMRDTGVDEPRFLHAGDDLDRVTERVAGALEEGLLAMGAAQCVRSHDAHAVRAHIAQSLPETLQAGERTGCHILVDAAVLLDARGQAHHLAQAVDDDELAVRVARHDHVEAIGAEVYRGEDIGDG